MVTPFRAFPNSTGPLKGSIKGVYKGPEAWVSHLPKGSNVVPFWVVYTNPEAENRSEPKRNYITASGYLDAS